MSERKPEQLSENEIEILRSIVRAMQKNGLNLTGDQQKTIERVLEQLAAG